MRLRFRKTTARCALVVFAAVGALAVLAAWVSADPLTATPPGNAGLVAQSESSGNDAVAPAGQQSEVDTLPAESTVLKVHPYKSPRLREILKRKTLRVGMHAAYPPFRIPDEGSPTGSKYPGIDVELAHDLANFLGVELEFQYGGIEELMDMIQTNRIDIAFGGISSTLTRARYVQFAAPYLITTPAALLSKDRLPSESQSSDFPRKRFRGIIDLQSLDRLALGVVAGTTTESLLREDPIFSKHRLRTFATRKELIEAFDKNKVDAIIADAVYITALTLRNPGYLSRAVALLQPYREEHLSPIVAYGDSEFLEVINFFIKEMRRTGRLDGLQRKYLESDQWVD